MYATGGDSSFSLYVEPEVADEKSALNAGAIRAQAIQILGCEARQFTPFSSSGSRLKGFSNRPCRSTPSCRRFPLDQALSSFGVGPRFLCHQFS